MQEEKKIIKTLLSLRIWMKKNINVEGYGRIER
jgi:hypothetical protein